MVEYVHRKIRKACDASRKILQAASLLSVGYPERLSLFSRRCASTRARLRLAILFGLPFDADYQTLVVVRQSGTSTSRRREYSETLQFHRLRRAQEQRTGRLSFGRAAEKARQSLWDFIRDYQREGSAAGGGGSRGVANKRVKKRATGKRAEEEDSSIAAD